MVSLRYLSVTIILIGIVFKIIHSRYSDTILLIGGIAFSLLWIPHLIRKYIYKR